MNWKFELCQASIQACQSTGLDLFRRLRLWHRRDRVFFSFCFRRPKKLASVWDLALIAAICRGDYSSSARWSLLSSLGLASRRVPQCRSSVFLEIRILLCCRSLPLVPLLEGIFSCASPFSFTLHGLARRLSSLRLFATPCHLPTRATACHLSRFSCLCLFPPYRASYSSVPDKLLLGSSASNFSVRRSKFLAS